MLGEKFDVHEIFLRYNKFVWMNILCSQMKYFQIDNAEF